MRVCVLQGLFRVSLECGATMFTVLSMFLHLTLPSPCLQLTAYCTRFSHPAVHRTHQSVSYIRTASRTVDRTAVAVLRSSTARPVGLASRGGKSPLIIIERREGRIKRFGLHWIYRLLGPRISMKPKPFNCTGGRGW